MVASLPPLLSISLVILPLPFPVVDPLKINSQFPGSNFSLSLALWKLRAIICSSSTELSNVKVVSPGASSKFLYWVYIALVG